MSLTANTCASPLVLVVGDVVLNQYWHGDVSRISPEAPVPIVAVKTVEDRLGGAANVANNIAALGLPVGVLGIVGEDGAASRIEQLASAASVAPYLIHDNTIQTVVKLRVLGRTQQLLRIDLDATAATAAVEQQRAMFTELLPAAQVVVFCGRRGAMATPTAMISEARRQGKIVLVDPKDEDYAVYADASIITPNRAELAEVVGPWRDEEDLIVRAQQLRERLRCDTLLLTRAEEGMTLFSKDGVEHLPTARREVYDVSGAGDTVIATLAAMLAEGRPLKEAAMLANAAAGIVIGKIGTATVSREELFS